ncbi:hypothetical protein [Salinirarus marinus]|uniref:hypothetical protein n=1 Tax=Salinirarus marinus TaxID=3068310 RepID=UPI003C6C63A5
MSEEPKVSRRALLAGLTAMGAVGSLTGVGTASYLLDTERVPANVTAGTVVLDAHGETDGVESTILDFDDVGLGDVEVGELCVSLADGSNPAWTWIRLCVAESDASVLCVLDAEATITGASDFAGDVTVSGSLYDVLTGVAFDGRSLSEGVLVAGNDREHLAGDDDEICLVLTLSLPSDLDQAAIEDVRGANLRLGFDAVAEQTRHVVASNPFTSACTVPPCEPPVESKDEPAISFLAFCADGGVDGGDVTLTVASWKDGDPYVVDWTSTVPVDTVIVKAGDGGQRYDVGGATSGTVSADGGTPGSVTPSAPCPDGSAGVKFDWNGGGWDDDSTGRKPGSGRPDAGDDDSDESGGPSAPGGPSDPGGGPKR